MTRKDELEMKKDAALPEESGTDTADMGISAMGGYVDPYAGQIQELYEGIRNRQPFQYDVDSDAMYQALKDQYVAGGQMAMMDTMGQAAQLTGGYGNSYAQGVGQQAYQNYLRGLTDQMPNLYDMALQNYIQTGNAMLQEYDMLQDMAAQDYGMWQDQMELIQPQVLEMLQAGKRPSQEMLAQSGLSQEYVDAMYPEQKAGGSGANELYIDEGSDWFQKEKDAFADDEGWLSTSQGKSWLNSEEGTVWKNREYEKYGEEMRAAGFSEEEIAEDLAAYKKKYGI